MLRSWFLTQSNSTPKSVPHPLEFIKLEVEKYVGTSQCPHFHTSDSHHFYILYTMISKLRILGYVDNQASTAHASSPEMSPKTASLIMTHALL